MLVNTYDTNINKAFANIYSSFADAMFKKITGEKIVEKGSVWVEMG